MINEINALLEETYGRVAYEETLDRAVTLFPVNGLSDSDINAAVGKIQELVGLNYEVMRTVVHETPYIRIEPHRHQT